MITNLSDYGWYPSEYKIDIHERLKVLEKERHVFQNRSPQKEYRSSLIKWLRNLFKKVEFCKVSLHLAVLLLDLFMDSHSIKPEKLTLIAFICFVLAGKFAEREANIPKISDMNEILKSRYSKADIIYLEKIILQYFKWKLTMPTALHFAEFYMDYAIVSDDICENCSNYHYVYTVIRNAVSDYLEISLEDDSLIKDSPSFIAASCILVVRKSFKLDPFWPHELGRISNYTESELSDCAAHILKFKEKYQNQRKRKLEQSPDQGYETGSTGSPCSLKSRK